MKTVLIRTVICGVLFGLAVTAAIAVWLRILRPADHKAEKGEGR